MKCCPRDGKVSYANAMDAQTAAYQQGQRRGGNGGLRAYKCPYCPWHHVGHPIASRIAAARRRAL